MITLRDVGKTYGATPVLTDIGFDIPSGSFTVIVGPSGCGKSTLLRMISGLIDITEGELAFDGARMNEVDAGDRGVSMVFQSYALYPHMTVRENMSFSLKIAKTPKAEAARKVEAAAEALRITPLLNRKPRELSGGQRQRVAIGRAIVRDPKVFLFDEPLSNLDADLRVQMRVELAKLHEMLGNTMVYVTHDQVEAMTLADRIVVMRDGRVEQIGPPDQLYDDPANLFVASFIGTPRTNVLRAEATGDGRLALAAGPTIAPPLAGPPPPTGAAVHVTVRPELMDRPDLGPPELELEGRVEVIENLGGLVNIHLALPSGETVVVQRRARGSARVGRTERAGIRLEDLRVFDANGGRLR
jgi:lactose/L-arabinose transport system ATP-binding protein